MAGQNMCNKNSVGTLYSDGSHMMTRLLRLVGHCIRRDSHVRQRDQFE